MIKKILPFIVITLMLGCATSTSKNDVNKTDPTTEVITFDNSTFGGIIVCKHKYDTNRQFKYYQKNAVRYEIDNKLSMYKIIDINDNSWFINNFEILNYHCVKN